ncbi:MAG: type II toxin-antitoxin system VapC family toxin [Planctomycetes bacterium]|nr:type II toxin-antitoxin system VapC family toxin [Planctomycetota bacterium]
MPAKRPRLLDSYALLAFLERERGSLRVKAALQSARATGTRLLMNEINVGEVYYTIARERSPELAEAFLVHLERLPIKTVSNSFADVLAAARIKAQFSLSYADAFAVATAIREKAVVMTGDPEFQAVQHLVTMEWV